MQDASELLRRARSNDPAALAEVYDRFAPGIYAYIYRRVGDQRLAEDLTGDVFVQVVGALRRRQFARTALRAWLYTLAHNRVVDHYRRNPPDPLPLDERLPAAADVPQAAQARQRQNWLRAALRRLTGDQQQVLALRFGEQLSAPEAARVMGKTEEAVRALQHRALGALRRLMDESIR